MPTKPTAMQASRKRKIVASDDGVALSLDAIIAGNPPPGPPREPPTRPDEGQPGPYEEPPEDLPEPDLPDEDDPDEDEPQIGAAGNAGDASADLHEQHQLAEMNAEVDELLARDDSFQFAPTHPAPPRRTVRGTVRYEARIQILDAFQYPGAVKDAPDWVDRNWIGYADQDELRNIPSGPCLRVPLATGEVAICRTGDFVARQEIRLVADQPGDIRIEVWPQEQFFKLFMPVHEKPHRPFMSGVTATIEHEV